MAGQRRNSVRAQSGGIEIIPVPPSDAAIAVTCYLASTLAYGSAVLIGPSFALTAAHNLYDSGTKATSVNLKPGHPKPTDWERQSTAFVCHERYLQLVDPAYDIALVYFSTPFTHTKRFPTFTYTDPPGAKIRIVGYPKPTAFDFGMYEHSTMMMAREKGRLVYSGQTKQGQSGGPVFSRENGPLGLLGIHAYGPGDAPANFPGMDSATALRPELETWIEEAKLKLRGTQ